MKLLEKYPFVIGSMSKEELDEELLKGMTDIEKGKVYSADDVENEMRNKYGI